MIGYRGASRYIREPDIFALEVEAIKQVRKQYRNLYVMVPFVRTPAELRGVKHFSPNRAWSEATISSSG